MTTGSEAGKDIRIARHLARRGAPGSYAYVIFTVLVVGLTGLWKSDPVTAGILVAVNLTSGWFRKRLSLRFDADYPANPSRWAAHFLGVTLVFAVAWGFLTIMGALLW